MNGSTSRNGKAWLVLVVLVLWIVFALISFLIGFLAEWFVRLDEILTAELFATLSGLSLAAAAFLITGIEQIEAHIPGAEKAEDDARREARDEDDRSDAEDWFKREAQPAVERIRAKSFSYLSQRYLLRSYNVWRLKKSVRAVVDGKENFILSFVLLALGLVESITIDLWVEAGSALASAPDTISGLGPYFLGSLTKFFSFVDVVASSVLLLLGVYFLFQGSLALWVRIAKSQYSV